MADNKQKQDNANKHIGNESLREDSKWKNDRSNILDSINEIRDTLPPPDNPNRKKDNEP
ncbi:MAG: hypothetical protein QX189_11020 [Methylococcales bacterium]